MIYKLKWSPEYYDMVMSILSFVICASNEDISIPMSSDTAKDIFGSLAYRAHVTGYEHGTEDCPIRVVIEDRQWYKLREFLDTLDIDDPDVTPFNTLVKEFSEDVFEKYDRYMTARDKKKADILVRIKDYVTECNIKGVKPVKKHLVTEEHSYELILKVWREYSSILNNNKSEE